MAKNMKTRKGKDGFDYPYTSPDLVVDATGKSASKKFEDINLQLTGIANNFTTEQTGDSFIIKYGNKIIAEIPIGGGTTPVKPVVKKYTITSTLTNATGNNNTTEIEENQPYTATITPNKGYTLTGATVTITMSGKDITSTVYNGGNINIAKVTGNIVIKVSAVEVSTPPTPTGNPLSNIIADIRDYSESDTDIFVNEKGDTCIKDNINKEDVRLFPQQKMMCPFKTFPGTNTSSTPTTIYNNLIENVNSGKDCAFIYITKDVNCGFSQGKLDNKIVFKSYYGDYGWNTWQGDCLFPYTNTSNEKVTPTSQVKNVDITKYTIPSSKKEWGRRIFTIILKANGVCEIYLDNALLFSFGSPVDFKAWDFTYIQGAWNLGVLLQTSASSFAPGKTGFEYIITCDTINSDKLTQLYEYLVKGDVSTNIVSEDDIYMQKGDSYKTYSEVLP